MTRLSFLVSLTVDFQYSAMVEGQRSASQPSKVGESLLAARSRWSRWSAMRRRDEFAWREPRLRIFHRYPHL